MFCVHFLDVIHFEMILNKIYKTLFIFAKKSVTAGGIGHCTSKLKCKSKKQLN